MYTGTAAAKKSIRTDISLDLCAQCPASTTRSMPGEGRIRGLEFRVEGFRGLGLRAQGIGSLGSKCCHRTKANPKPRKPIQNQAENITLNTNTPKN